METTLPSVVSLKLKTLTPDTYYTIAKAGEAKYTEKMSRFLAFAFHIESAEEARLLIKEYQNDYHDARHVCWAYALGPKGDEYQLNDNGEPSGTAGKPILGQIRSKSLTDVLVMVVRYFGGIKLGTSGLIGAYREAASMALDDAGRKECFETVRLLIEFPYISADGVMKIVKSQELCVISQQFDNICSLLVEVRKSMEEEIMGRLSKLEGVRVEVKN